MRNRDGFSLVEILVVVTIIALLTGLVVPLLIRIQNRAKVAACRESIEQIGLALDTYASDFQAYPEDPWKNWTDAGPGRANDAEMPQGYPSYLYFLINNPKAVYFNAKDASLTGDRRQKDVLALDAWGKPLIYVRAPYRRDLGIFYRAFPNSGKYNLWSVGPDGKCGSCDWKSDLNTDTVALKGDHADGEPEVDPLGKMPHVGGHRGTGGDDVGNW